MRKEDLAPNPTRPPIAPGPMGSVPYIGPRLGDGPIFGISSIVHNLFYTRFEFWVNKL